MSMPPPLKMTMKKSGIDPIKAISRSMSGLRRKSGYDFIHAIIKVSFMVLVIAIVYSSNQLDENIFKSNW
jgi:hypothetical protein